MNNISKRCSKCGITLGAENISCPICGGNLDIVGGGGNAAAPPFGQQSAPYQQGMSYQQQGMPGQQQGMPYQQQGMPGQRQNVKPPQDGQYIRPTGYIQSVTYQPPQTPPVQNVPPEPAKKSHKGLIIGIVSGAAVVAAAAVVVTVLALNGTFGGDKEPAVETAAAPAVTTTPAPMTLPVVETTTEPPVTTTTTPETTTATAATAPRSKTFYTEENDYAVVVGKVTMFPKELFFRGTNDLVVTCVLSNGLEKPVIVSGVNKIRMYDKNGDLFLSGAYTGMEVELEGRYNDEYTFYFDQDSGAVINTDPDLSEVTIECECVYTIKTARYYSEAGKDSIRANDLGFIVKEAYYQEDGSLYFTCYCSNGRDNPVFVHDFEYLNICDGSGNVIAGAAFRNFCIGIPSNGVVEYSFYISPDSCNSFRTVDEFNELTVQYNATYTDITDSDKINMHLIRAYYNDDYDIVLETCFYNNKGRKVTLNYLEGLELYDEEDKLIAKADKVNVNADILKDGSIYYKITIKNTNVYDNYADLSDPGWSFTYNYSG